MTQGANEQWQGARGAGETLAATHRLVRLVRLLSGEASPVNALLLMSLQTTDDQDETQ